MLAVFARSLTGLFTESDDVVQIASMYLFIVPVSFGALGVVLIASTSFNALGKPMPSAILTLTRTMLLYVPLAFIGRAILGTSGIFAAACAANFIAAVWGLAWIRKACKPTQQQVETK